MSEQETQIVQTSEFARATELNIKIKANASIAQSAIFEIGRALQEMRDGKMYKHLGYENFEQYCTTEIGISKRQSYRYIGIVEKLGENVPPGAQNIGVMKLSMLSELSDDERETIMKSTDLEAVSKRELQSKIDQIKAEKDSLTEQLAATEEKMKVDGEMHAKKLEEAKRKQEELQKQYDELLSRPVEVAVDEQSAKESESLRAERDVLQSKIEKQSAKIKKMEEQYKKQNAEASAMTEETLKRYENEIAQLKFDLANAEKPEEVAIEVPDIKEMFKIHLKCTIDAAKNMIVYLHDHPDDACREQAKKALSSIAEQV